MKLKKRILSGALALTMVAGSFFINSGQASAATPTDPNNIPATCAQWAFTEDSVPLHDAILAEFPEIDNNPQDNYISVSEANAWVGYGSDNMIVFPSGRTNIGGTLDGIQHFSKIVQIVLANNSFTGKLPDLTGLTNLKVLTLNNNQLSGEITSGLFTNKIERINLASNNLSGAIPSVMPAPQLRWLLLSNNSFQGEIPELPTTLIWITFSGNKLNINAVIGDDTSLIDSLTQDKIDLASADLENISLTGNNPVDNATVQAKIDHAQSLLDQRNAAESEVADLFNSTNIATGITETEIADAELLVEALPSPSETYTALTDQIALGRQMLEAKDTVDALLTITTGNTNLTVGVTQADITSAQALVTALDDATAGALKIELQAKIDTAQDLLDGAKLVSDLFTDGTKTALATSVTQGAIDAAKIAVEALPVGDTQDALLADIATARGLLDAKTLADAKDVAKAELDQKATDAKTEIDALPNLTSDEKTAAKNAVDNALTDAKDAVNLATTPAEVVTEKDSGVTKINDEVTKAEALDTLNAAKTAAKAELDQKATDANNAINALPNLTEDQKTAEKNKVNTDLNDAKTTIDSGTDTTAVNNAKNSGDTNITNDLNGATALDAANLADAKTAAKAELEAKATAVKDAIDALTGLSTAEKNTAKDAINAELDRGINAIDAATTIPKVTEEKTTSIDNMDNILAKAQKLSDAKNAVNDLFDNTGKIKDTVNQDIINNAKEKVNELELGSEKDGLNILIAEAEKQLAAKNQVNPTPINPIDRGTSTQTKGNVATGDDSTIMLYGMGLLLAAAGLSLVVRRKMIKG